MSGKRIRRGLHLGGVVMAIAMVTLVLPVTGCCVRPVYNATPTAPTRAASPVSTPTATLPVEQPTPTILGPALLSLEPPVILDFAVGEMRQMQVLIENVEGLHEIELHISFEPRYVNIEDADPDTPGVQIETGMVPVPAQVIQNEANNDSGFIVYHVAQGSESPATGSGVVASFTVRALAEGGSPLKFTAVNLNDAEGQPLPAPEQANGLVTIAGGAVASEPTAGAPTSVVPTTPTATAPVGGEWETVQAGDTLYQVCRRHCPHRWPPASAAFDSALKAYAEQVARLNGLGWPDPVIRPGQRLEMPTCP